MSKTLTLYFYPSPAGLDWASPSRLARSAAAGARKSLWNPIGHVTVALGDDHAGMTTAQLWKVPAILLLDGGAMEVLLHGFRGRLQRRGEIEPKLAAHARSGRLSFLRYELNDATFARLRRYLDEYRARGVGAIYGLPQRPLHGEGAGCSAFAVSFLQVAGLLDPTLTAAFSRAIRIPEALVGGRRTGRRVPARRLFGRRAVTAWARPEERHFPVDFWDPDRMHAWLEGAWRDGTDPPALPFRRVEEGGAHGLAVDARGHQPPSGPIWAVEGAAGAGAPLSR